MKVEEYKYPKKFITLECKNDLGEVLGYAPVSGWLISENKRYYFWGGCSEKYEVASEMEYSTIKKDLVKLEKENDIYANKVTEYQIFDNYEDCKQACIKENERILSEEKSKATAQAYAYKMDSEQMLRCVKRTQKRYADIQDKILETTDKLYGEKSKSLDGSKAKQVVEKVNNNKENQGK